MSEDTSEIIIVEDDLPEGKGRCEACAGIFSITRTGALRSHKCLDGTTVVKTTRSPKVTRKGRHKTPASVRRVLIPPIASGIEWGAETWVCAVTDLTPDTVPTVLDGAGDPVSVVELPDAEAMIGPLLDAVWPQIPTRAKTIISDLADKEELILCLLAWLEYGRNLQKLVKGNQGAAESTESVQPTYDQDPYAGAVWPDSTPGQASAGD